MIKRILYGFLLLSPVVLAAQNTFPSTGNVGIGTTSPHAALTVAGNMYNSGTIGGRNSFYNVLQVGPLADAPAYFYFDTNIPATGNTAPQLQITGYTYGAANKALKLTLGWYYWAGDFYWCQYQSDLGYEKPSRIRVGKYTKSGTEYIRVEISNNSGYWSQYTVSAVDGIASTYQYEGWVWYQGEMPSGTTSQITEASRWQDISIEGKLGIGTNSPGAWLHVKGDNAIFGTNTGSFTQHIQQGGAGGKYHLALNGSTRLTIDNDGRMGLGTQSPVDLLHLEGSDIGIRLLGQSRSRLNLMTASQGGWQIELSDADGNQRSGDLGFTESGVAAGRLVLKKGGNIGIGILDPTERLAVNGNVKAKKIIVSQSNWPDYVFSPGYKLKPLSELDNFIHQHKRLPEMPSAEEVDKSGVSVGDSQALLLKKIEELTLYVIELKKENNRQQKEINLLKRKP